MPVVTLPSAGDTATASAEAGQKYVFELEPNTLGSSYAGGAVAWIECDGLPEVFVWLRQTPGNSALLNGGLAGCTFTPVFSVSLTTGVAGVGVAAEWLPLTAPQSIPFGSPGVPIYFRDRIPGASAIGVWINTPVGVAGVDNSTFEVVLGASQ